MLQVQTRLTHSAHLPIFTLTEVWAESASSRWGSPERRKSGLKLSLQKTYEVTTQEAFAVLLIQFMVRCVTLKDKKMTDAAFRPVYPLQHPLFVYCTCSCFVTCQPPYDELPASLTLHASLLSLRTASSKAASSSLHSCSVLAGVLFVAACSPVHQCCPLFFF